MSTTVVSRADAIAARATGLGVGLIVFMVTWSIGARITERIFDAPAHAYVAMGMALLAGAVTTVRAGHRLGRATSDAQHVNNIASGCERHYIASSAVHGGPSRKAFMNAVRDSLPGRSSSGRQQCAATMASTSPRHSTTRSRSAPE